MPVPEGYLLVMGAGTYGEGIHTERATYHCCHCQRMVIVEPGSGEKRGFCFKCMEPNCGRKKCVTRCVPWEKALEKMESRNVR